jgi:hypothetical protein
MTREERAQKGNPVGAVTIRQILIGRMGLSYLDVIASCELVAKELREAMRRG